MVSLTNAQSRSLKAQAQRMKATLKIGKEGLSSSLPWKKPQNTMNWSK